MDDYTKCKVEELGDVIRTLDRADIQSMDRRGIQDYVNELRKARRQLDKVLEKAEDQEREHLYSAFERVTHLDKLAGDIENFFENLKGKMADYSERPD